jgi:hypothetical protein
MKIRPAEDKDWEAIVRISNAHYTEPPDFQNFLTLPVIVNDKDEVVAFGYLRHFVEATFMPDLTGSKKVIVIALRMLQTFALNYAKEFKLRRIHSFVTDPKFKQVLMKHFKYKIRNGDALFFDKD